MLTSLEEVRNPFHFLFSSFIGSIYRKIIYHPHISYTLFFVTEEQMMVVMMILMLFGNKKNEVIIRMKSNGSSASLFEAFQIVCKIL